MIPAHQRLEAGHFAIGEPHDRLVDHRQFLALDGPAQVGLELQPVGACTAEGGAEGFDPVSARPLGAVHGKFGVGQKSGRVLLLVNPGDEADRGGEDDLAIGEIERHHDRLRHGIGKVGDLGRIAFRHEDQAELVAGKPCQRVLRLHQAAQPTRQRDQDIVAGGDAETVVDLLVAVDVDRHHGRAHRLRAARQRQHRLQPVKEDLAIGQAGQVVVHGAGQQPVDRVLLLGDIDDRADAADDLAVRAEHGTGADLQPMEVAVFCADAEFVVEATLAVFEQHVERGAEAVAIVGMEPRQPVARRAVHGARRQAETERNVGGGDHPVTRHVPVPDRIARAGQRQRLALEVGKQALLVGPAGKGVLHHGEADQKHDQHQPAAERRLDDVVVELPRHRQPATEQPDEDQCPGRDQKDGAVVAVEAEIEDQNDAGRRGQRKRQAGNAGGDRRIVDRHAEQERQAEDPGEGGVAEMHVPAIEIEIGEEEDDEARSQHHFRARPPHALVAGGDADQLFQEAEVDADIGEHRPGQRRRRRQHGCALDHEQDRQEHRQQAGNAKHDTTIEREGVHRVLVGVRLPQIDLWQAGGRKLGDEGDHGAGIEGDAEDVGIRARHAVERKAFRRRDRDDALRAEVWPEHARTGEAEMRGDDDALQLFLRDVGEREHRPVALMRRRGGAHLDAAANAVGTGGGRDLEGIALVGVDLGRGGQVERGIVAGDLHGFRSQRHR